MPEDDDKVFQENIRAMMARFDGVLGMNRPPDSAKTGPSETPDESRAHEVVRAFCQTPRQIYAHLDRYVIGQEEAKKALAVSVCDHYNQVRRSIEKPETNPREYLKHNVLLLGPTGVGKTYLVRCLARRIGVPFVKADATKFSETGYVGHDVEDLVRDLVRLADGDVKLAQYGIIYLDEIDKISTRSNGGTRDVSGRGVQINLLKLMEESEVGIFSQTDLIGQMQAILELQRGKDNPDRTISTRNILFIVSGAFSELSDMVRRRLGSRGIGFGSESSSEREDDSLWMNRASTEDFIAYGFEPEFVGRLPVRVACHPLTEADLLRILNDAEDSVLEQYRADFLGYGIELRVSEKALHTLAHMAYEEKTGARGLLTVMERVLRPFKFELPSLGVESWTLDEQAIRDPERVIQEIKAKHGEDIVRQTDSQLEACVASVAEQSGVTLVFTPAARRMLIERCRRDNIPMEAFFARHFADAAYGLRLWRDAGGGGVFRATVRFVTDPDAELSRRITRRMR